MKIKKSDLLILIFVIGSLLVTGLNYGYHASMRDQVKTEQEIYNIAYNYVVENCERQGYYNSNFLLPENFSLYS